MFEQIEAYIEYLKNFGKVLKPAMPKFDVLAYTDSEYQNAINCVMQDYEKIDDVWLTIDYLKGE